MTLLAAVMAEAAAASLTMTTTVRKRKLGCNDVPLVSSPMPKLQALPSRRKTSPADYALRIFKENGYDLVEDPAVVTLPFLRPTDKRIAAYTLESVNAVRLENITELRRLHSSGLSLDCCNRFGESLVSMACRRGNADVVRFLVQEAEVPLLLRDDYGRTVLHDACWTSAPKLELVEFLIQQIPELLCVKDVRGHAPLDYVRNEHWDEWTLFLQERKGLLRPKLSSSC